jgi:predicted ArsR family transcriptional regulator
MSQPSFEKALSVVAALRDPTRRRLYGYVERQPVAVSRDEAARELGISRALAAFHLEKLVSVGLLRPEYRRLSGRTGRGAGRTSKLYRRSATHFELTLPQRQYELLARLLAESMADGESSTAESGAAFEYGRSLGRRARQEAGKPRGVAKQLECVEHVAGSLGFDPYRDESGDVRLRNCPFDPLSRVYTPVVCGVTDAMLNGVVEGVGAKRLTVSREMHADRCCGIVSRVAAVPKEPM